MVNKHSSVLRHSNQRIEDYLESQEKLDTLRFITCGSVDDGKSTLIGRMLYEAQLLLDDQVQSLQKESKKIGTQGENIDFALLVDGLSAEREQGITIDVAYRFFNTDRRKFIVADTPGHEQYTRNMVTGASTADLAIILIDARQGVLAQTKRHSFLCHLLGIKHVIVAINKMDLIGYDKTIFEKIESDYSNFSTLFSFKSIHTIPLSALKGDNIIRPSQEMRWYKGSTLFGLLETINITDINRSNSLRFPVQWVNRPNQNFRGFSGMISSGELYKNMPVSILPSGQKAKIKDIILGQRSLEKAHAPQSITVTLDREVDVSRGDVIVDDMSPCQIADQFAVKIIWMDQEPGFLGRSYYLKIGTTVVNAQISQIKNKIDINNYQPLSAQEMIMNEIYEAKINLDKAIPFEAYKVCPSLGSFILIDRLTNRTVASGLIEHSLRRSHNLHLQKLTIDKQARQHMKRHASKALWFTGLSGAGKSTVANALEKALYQKGLHTYLLDGDNMRHGLNKDLGFSIKDRVENIRRISEVAKLMTDAGIIVLIAFISPFRTDRQTARNLFAEGDFIEIFIDTPLEVAEERDPKGLYKKARQGEIPNFTGIDSPYEPPLTPEIHVDTTKMSVSDIVNYILENIQFDLGENND